MAQASEGAKVSSPATPRAAKRFSTMPLAKKKSAFRGAGVCSSSHMPSQTEPMTAPPSQRVSFGSLATIA
ncbi:hypothetical protein D3C78_1694110 [compost metagenome]